ncbi:MAG: hypothetical protein U9Q67_02730 [Patescibacteria group bacterium]|nr:hypothetical protein [Patescibacteria group bacterium]
MTEFQKLVVEYPVPVYFGHANKDFLGDYGHHCENAYMSFDSNKLSNCAYIYDSERCSDCMDMEFSLMCERCYMTVNAYKCSNSSYLSCCRELVNCEFCYDCFNCQDCFGCVDIANKQFCFFNKQLKKESYAETVAEYKKQHSVEQIMADFIKLAETIPVAATSGDRNSDMNTEYSDTVYRSQNVYMSYEVADSQNLLYSDHCYYCTDCVDITFCFKCENCYSCVDTGHSNSCVGTYFSDKGLECMYCYYCNNCQDCIGCVGLEGKKNCVLNRQVDKAKYDEIKQLIKENPEAEIEL